MTAEPSPEVPETAIASGHDHQPGIPPGPIDPEERAVLDDLRDPGGEVVRGDVVDEAIAAAPENS